MAFAFSEEQRDLADTVDRLLGARATGDHARRVITEPAAWRPLWDEVAALGVIGMAAPEAVGGLELGPVELVAVSEAVGRHLAPAPIVATAGGFVPVVAQAAGDGASDCAALRAVVEDGATGAVAYADPRTPGEAPRLRGDRLTAELVVPDAERIDHLAVLARRDDGTDALVVVDLARASTEPAATIDDTRPLLRASFSGADVADGVFPAEPAVLDVAFATAAAELVGMADAMLQRSVEHAKERVQFGAPIGSFQAIKHRLADALIAVERARSHAYHAAVALADAPGSQATSAAAHFAKAAAGDAATGVARAAVQVHGGVGITREHDISLMYLRARQAALAMGGADTHLLAAVADELLRP